MALAVAARARLRGRRRHLGPHRRSTTAIQPGAEELRLQPAAVLDHRRAQADRRLQRPVLHRQPGDRRLRRLRRHRRHHAHRPEGAEARRRGRHHQPRVHHRRHPARRRAVRLQRQRRRQGGARRPSRSTRSSSTCRRRSTSAAVEIEGTKVIGQFPADAGGTDRRVRPAVRQGQPARRVRQPRTRGADRERRARHDRADSGCRTTPAPR